MLPWLLAMVLLSVAVSACGAGRPTYSLRAQVATDSFFHSFFDSVAQELKGVTAQLPGSATLPAGAYHFELALGNGSGCRDMTATTARCAFAIQMVSAWMPLADVPNGEIACQAGGSCDPNTSTQVTAGQESYTAVLTVDKARCIMADLTPTGNWTDGQGGLGTAPPDGTPLPTAATFMVGQNGPLPCGSADGARASAVSPPTAKRSVASANTHDCGGWALPNTTPPTDVKVTRSSPAVTCAVALETMRDLFAGKGVPHPGATLSASYTTVHGWHCVSGTGNACTRSRVTIFETEVPASSLPSASGATSSTSTAAMAKATTAPVSAIAGPAAARALLRQLDPLLLGPGSPDPGWQCDLNNSEALIVIFTESPKVGCAAVVAGAEGAYGRGVWSSAMSGNAPNAGGYTPNSTASCDFQAPGDPLRESSITVYAYHGSAGPALCGALAHDSGWESSSPQGVG
jgi:hypothetical protein